MNQKQKILRQVFERKNLPNQIKKPTLQKNHEKIVSQEKIEIIMDNLDNHKTITKIVIKIAITEMAKVVEIETCDRPRINEAEAIIETETMTETEIEIEEMAEAEIDQQIKTAASKLLFFVFLSNL